MKAHETPGMEAANRGASRFTFGRRLLFAFFIQFIVWIPASTAQAQRPSSEVTLSRQELARLIMRSQTYPDERSGIMEEVRRRGIGFVLSDAVRSEVKSDALLVEVLDGAERNRAKRVAAAGLNEGEVDRILKRTKEATLAARDAMPDFIVKQVIKRTTAVDTPPKWLASDTLIVRARYQQSGKEEYKLLSIDGKPTTSKEATDYSDYVRGVTTSGEYVSSLANIFTDASLTGFALVDSEVVRWSKTAVYEYSISRFASALVLRADKNVAVGVALRGRVWIDVAKNRVLRFEHVATEIPADFPIKDASTTIDYDWVTINGKPYLLPITAEMLSRRTNDQQLTQSFNQVSFVDYQKFAVELKIEEVEPAGF